MALMAFINHAFLWIIVAVNQTFLKSLVKISKFVLQNIQLHFNVFRLPSINLIHDVSVHNQQMHCNVYGVFYSKLKF